METRQNRRRKKLRKGRVFFVLTILFTIGIVAFSTTQYWLGTQMSKEAKGLDMSFEEEFQGVKSSDSKVNVLLIGVDSRGEEQSRSDTMMIAQWDGKNDEIKLVSLMRDIYVDIPGYQSYKLNTAFYLNGPELLRQTIKENFDIDVEHYMLIDFGAFEGMVDALAPNGVEIDVEKAMSEKIGVSLEPGRQKLNGKELLGYARFRADEEGDFGRVNRQQKVIEAVKDHAVSLRGVMNTPKLLGVAQPYIQTNMTNTKQIEIMSRILLSGGADVNRLTIPVENGYWDASYPGVGSVLELDWEANNAALKEFLDEK
ncbi:LytR family transcriptional regulator [Jeotgalibacillus sp. S-D1]|uniref:LCP family protein n=1 Tax=Jeotgalibacillus sp. S-D1 TaxID=2552189 RepID=UPI0010597988|nr:LCP family protein [Jeotgalibacillus sp. S-D1]TDL34901.1 LytR family transcriptional regulator [Jeotgalibacillus sp. S-D1]